MVQIQRVEIKYFRSVYHATIKNLKDMNILSGKNDCGKSNVLRALNLFFNNETDWKSPIDFGKDFCQRRLEECRKDAIKGKQFIQVKVHFVRGKRYENSIPEKFWVSRTWHRDSSTPSEKNSLRDKNILAQSMARAQASLQRYLGTIHYEYVPAVKDRRFFNYSLGILKDAILQSRTDDSLKDAVSSLNSVVTEEAASLRKEFLSVTDVDIDIHLPSDLEELFRAFAVTTGGADGLPLSVRGDGIQSRFLPSLLHHVAVRSKKHYIWGFEEPENCLEHSLATSLAQEMMNDYANESQILVTSHSPAFICLDAPNIYMLHVNRKLHDTEVQPFEVGNNELHADLGLMGLQKQYQADYEFRLSELSAAHETIKKVVADSVMPKLLVEGDSDVLILNEAWQRLYPDKDMPYKLISCSVAGASENSKAGCGVLAKALESCRLDQPITMGLLDYDDAGLKAFNLDKNFEVSDFSNEVKIHKNEHASCIIYPCISGLEGYWNARNLCIEFLFPESCLQKKVSNIGLSLSQKMRIVRVEGYEEEKVPTTEPHYRKVDNGKIHFAEKIVPKLKDEDFEGFRPVFELVSKTLSELK